MIYIYLYMEYGLYGGLARAARRVRARETARAENAIANLVHHLATPRFFERIRNTGRFESERTRLGEFL